MPSLNLIETVYKCWYPRCVGQAAATWVLSPLSSNLLLSSLRSNEQVEKYTEVSKSLQNSDRCKIKTGIFSSLQINDENKLKSLHEDVSKNKVDFSKGEGAKSINQWVKNQHPIFKEFLSRDDAKVPTDTKFALVNTCIFECAWHTTNSEGGSMKIYNSFNYTQDINYEARIMELPMRDKEFRMVVLVPNNVDLLNTLFRRLINEGLAASFASVQPLFSVNTVFRSPNIIITSQTAVSLEKEFGGAQESLVQYGAIDIGGQDVRAYIMSCLYSTESKLPRPKFTATEREEKPCFFAITHFDTPIFIGQYTNQSDTELL